jgi:molecular chaperone GrpE (heat shock protein)
LFESKIRHDEVRARQVDALHGELEQYRRGLTHEFLRPVLTDLVRLHDDLAVQVEGVDEEDRPDGPAHIAAYVRGSIEETLARNGVESYTVDEPVVDRRRQKVIGLVATDDPALDRTVARRARPGFRFDDKILRPEWVHAYQLDRSASESDDVPPAAADDLKENQ